MITQQEAKESVQRATEIKNQLTIASIDLLIQSAALVGKKAINYHEPINDAVRFELKQHGYKVGKELFSQGEGYSTEISWC